jgi:hypothetical protein
LVSLVFPGINDKPRVKMCPGPDKPNDESGPLHWIAIRAMQLYRGKWARGRRKTVRPVRSSPVECQNREIKTAWAS